MSRVDVKILQLTPGLAPEAANAQRVLAMWLADGYVIDCCTPVPPFIYYTVIKRYEDEDEDEIELWER